MNFVAKFRAAVYSYNTNKMPYRLANLNRNNIDRIKSGIDDTENILNTEWNGNQNPELVKNSRAKNSDETFIETGKISKWKRWVDKTQLWVAVSNGTVLLLDNFFLIRYLAGIEVSDGDGCYKIRVTTKSFVSACNKM